jgi:hypothetical protein
VHRAPGVWPGGSPGLGSWPPEVPERPRGSGQVTGVDLALGGQGRLAAGEPEEPRR